MSELTITIGRNFDQSKCMVRPNYFRRFYLKKNGIFFKLPISLEALGPRAVRAGILNWNFKFKERFRH
jgi:hypothetical protein